MAAYEISPRELRQVGRDRWEGLRTILTTNGEAQFYATGMYGEVFPGTSGSGAPTAHKTRAIFEYRNVPGIAALMLYYQTAREAGPDGRARISLRQRPEAEELIRDLDDEIIVGPAEDGRHQYQLIEGTNLRPRPGGTDLVVETAVTASDFNLAETLGLIGFVNDSPLPNFGNADTETCLLRSLELNYQWGADLIYLDYFFGWDPRGWNEAIKVLKGAWAVIQEPSFAWNASTQKWEDTSANKYVLKFFPGVERTYNATDETWAWTETEPENRRVFETADYSQLDSRVVW